MLSPDENIYVSSAYGVYTVHLHRLQLFFVLIIGTRGSVHPSTGETRADPPMSDIVQRFALNHDELVPRARR